MAVDAERVSEGGPFARDDLVQENKRLRRLCVQAEEIASHHAMREAPALQFLMQPGRKRASFMSDALEERLEGL